MAVEIGGLRVSEILYDLVGDEIAPGTDVAPDAFWTALGEIVRDLGPGNRALLQTRDCIQEKMDRWYRERKARPIDREEYRAFLADIGYLVPEGDHFELTTARVDSEIANVAGPQLVVPVDNARYALNAANARWGSLYDALYGTDVIPEEPGAEKGDSYNPVRGARVIEAAEAFLDDAAGLASGRWSEATRFALEDADGTRRLVVALRSGAEVGLADPEQFVGYRKDEGRTLERAAGEQRSSRRDPDRPEPSGWRRASRWRQGRPAGGCGDDDPGLRGLGFGRGCGGQGACIRQLERNHEGNAGDDL